MTDITYKRSESGWKVATTDMSGITFFIGWDRLAKALSLHRPSTPELNENERIVAVKPDERGLTMYVEIVK